MSYTRLQLVTQALNNLGIIAEGQDVSAQELTKMDALVNGAMQEVIDLDIFYVDDFGELGPKGGAIDDGAFLSLAIYLANAACSAFNLPADEKMKALEQEAIGKLATLSRPPRARQRLTIDPILRGRGHYPKFPNNG